MAAAVVACACFCCPPSSPFRLDHAPSTSLPSSSLCRPYEHRTSERSGGRGRRIRHFSIHAGIYSVEAEFDRTDEGFTAVVGRGLATMVLSTILQFSSVAQLACANEFSVLGEGAPLESHVVDDASVLNRVTKSDLKRLLTDLEDRRGYHIDMVTLRKLTTKADVFEFADQVLERWYPTVEEGAKKGLVLLVTTQKEGAVTGGPAFINAVGDKVLESIVSDNLPVLATEEKYNEALFSTAKRLVAALDGLPDPGGPKFQENKRESNFKTREETEEKRGQFTTVVVGLLIIAFVVPMAQYYAYVSRK
eukprot:c22762_g1_i1 orf=101-1018(+)